MSRDSTHMGLDSGRASLRIADHLHSDDVLALLRNPDGLFADPECEIVKDQRKIKIGRVPLTLRGENRKVYLKRYNAFSWRYRLVSLFATSGAFRSWQGADILMKAGLHTASPTAAVEFRSWGMLVKSFYLSEEIPEAKPIDDYWLSDLLPAKGAEGVRQRKQFIKELAGLFRSLHAAAIYHNDLKDANILLRGDGHQGFGSFYLLDLEGIRKYRQLSRHHRLKNLVQLTRTMGTHVRPAEKLYFLKFYLGEAYLDRNTRRRWIQGILKRSARGDRRSLRKKMAQSG